MRRNGIPNAMAVGLLIAGILIGVTGYYVATPHQTKVVTQTETTTAKSTTTATLTIPTTTTETSTIPTTMTTALTTTVTAPATALVGCGSVITTDTTLSTDIGPCSGYGLMIDANGITLNCAGHRISGFAYNAGFGPDAGITLTAISGATVENCDVTGFTYGLRLTGSTNNHLTGNTASTNGFADFYLVTSSNNNALSGNTATNSNVYGFFLTRSFYNTLSANRANNNGYFGYSDFTTGSATAGTANTYSGDECTGNGSGGSSPSGLCIPQS
jgi:parallel beta-helix repeat protein